MKKLKVATGKILTGAIPPLLIIVVLGLNNPVYSSDHFDGPRVKAYPVADIVDLFAFPISSNSHPRLVLIMNLLYFAPPDAKFDNAVDHSFRIRRIEKVDGPGSKTKFHTAEEEIRISCRSEGGSKERPEQWLSCTVEGAKEVMTNKVKVNDQSGGSDNRLRLFAGLRPDQFFTDLARVRMPVWRDQSFAEIANKPGVKTVNSLANLNVLNLVVDLDVDTVLGGRDKGALFAVAAQTTVTYGGGEVRHIDRAARVEVNVFFVQDDTIRDLWNQQDTFHLNPSDEKSLRDVLQKGLSQYDNFEKSLTNDNVVDWETPHPLLDVLLDDFLVVDVSKPTTASSNEPGYLEIEMAAFRGKPHKTCGGRKPNENTLARTLTLFINGPDREAPDRGIGVDVPAKPAIDEFPYLQPPHNPAGWRP